MQDEQIRLYFQVIRQQMAALQKQDTEQWEGIEALLENLFVMYEQIRTDLEAAELIEEGLHQQNQRLAEQFHHYRTLFLASPIPYLITNARGLILEANQALADLLNVPQPHLARKPLILYLAEADHPAFYTQLNQLSQNQGLQVWQMHLRPRNGEPIAVDLHVIAQRRPESRDSDSPNSNLIESLRIGVHDISRFQQPVLPAIPQPIRETQESVEEWSRSPSPLIPQALDGLQVLVVDDEADAREFITAVLESHGIRVRAVASATAALAELEHFQPDVLVSDIRMPDGDGYSLIRQVRALEADQGRHIPAAAITAYVEEDLEKARSAGFEAYLHKLAQPAELLAMVAELAGRRERG